MTALSEADASFVHARPRLIGIARRVLVQPADADDVVQDAWMRWQETDRDRRARSVGVPDDDHDAARAQPRPVGPRAPRGRVGRPAAELSTRPPTLAPRRAGRGLSRTRCGSLLERLSPTERAVYVLREAFDYPHRRIAAAARARARRTCGRSSRAPAATSPASARGRSMPPRTSACSTAFLAAAQTGDLAPLEELLADAIEPARVRVAA